MFKKMLVQLGVVACLLLPEIALPANRTWLFSGSTTDGWTPINMAGYAVSGSYLRCNPNNDPRLLSPNLGMASSSNIYLKMGLRNNGTDVHGEVFFSNSAYPADQSRRGLFTVPSSGDFNNVVCWLGSIPNWGSYPTIDQIRIDPVWNGSGGNDSVLVDFIFIRDDIHVPNTPTITSVSPSGWTNGPITVYFESNDPSDYSGAGPDQYGSGVDYFRYRVDPQGDANVYPTWKDVWSGLTKSSVTYYPGQLAAGANYFHVYCFDKIQRVSSDTKTWLYYDPNPPSVPGSPVVTPNLSNANNFTASWGVSTDGLSGVNRYEWSINGVAGSTTSTSLVIPSYAVREGYNVFYVHAVDNVGLASGDAQYTFLLDTQSPSVPGSASVIPSIRNTNAFEFSWGLSYDNDQVAAYSYRINGGSRTSTPSDVFSVPLGAVPNIVEGTNTFEVRSIDRAGNVSADRQATFTYDTQTPTVPANVTVTPPGSGVNSFSMSWSTSTDATSGVRDYLWSVNGGQELSTTATSLPSSSYARGGLNTFAVRARDNAGNISLAGTATFWYTSPPSPAHIVINTDSLHYVAPPGGLLPDTQYVTISNSGGDDLRFNVSIDVPWLSYKLPIPEASNYFALPLYINTTNLPESTYTASITITSPNADNSPLTVKVVYYITTVYASSTCEGKGETAVVIPAIAGSQYLFKTSPTGPVTIYADRLVDCRSSSGYCLLSGNVNINKILYFSGDLTIYTQTLRLKSNGRAFIKFQGLEITLWDGNIDWKLQDAILKELLNPALSRLNLGGVKIQISELNMLSDGVGVKGVLEFPNIAGVRGTQISISNVEVTRSRGIRFIGSFNYAGPLALGPMTLRNLSLSVDNIGNNFSGGATVDVRFLTIGGSWAVASGKLNSVGLSVDIEPGVPLGASGLRLTGGNGNVNHLSDGQPLAITLGATIKGGFSIAGASVIEFSKYQFTIQPPSFLEGRGDFKIFGRQFSNMYARYENPKLSCGFNANIGGFYESKFAASLEKGQLRGSGNGVLKIPDFKIWKFTVKGKQIGGFQSTLVNNAMSGSSEVSVCAPFLGCSKLRASCKLEFKPQDFPPVHLWVGTNFFPLTRIFRRSAPGAAYSEVFAVDSTVSSAWFMVHGLHGFAPGFELIDPQGTKIDSTTAGFIRADEDSVAFYIIEGPTRGDWQVQIHEGSAADYEVEGLMLNGAPRIAITQPTSTTNSTELRWIDSDGDDNAHINFFYDNDGQGFDGAQINTDSIYEDDPTNSYVWNTASITPGTYHVYAVISDSTNAPYSVYAPGTITILNTYGLSAPANFQVVLTDSSFVGSWDRVVDTVAGYIIHYTDDTAASVFDKSIACGDTNIVEVLGVTPGRFYRLAVSSYDSLGHESEMSNSEVLEIKSQVVNNPPHITTVSPPENSIVGSEYTYALEASDADNDAVEFFLDSVPTGMAIVSSRISWIPDSSQVGPHNCRIVGRDGRGGSDTLTFSIQAIDSAAFLGTLGFDKVKYALPTDHAILTVEDIDGNTHNDKPDTVTARLYSGKDGTGIELRLHETGSNTAQFVGTCEFSLHESNQFAGRIWVNRNDTLGLIYQDQFPIVTLEARALFHMNSCCISSAGNVDCDPGDGVDISDLTSLIDFLYISFTPLCCPAEANTDGQPGLDISDLTSLIDYLYISFTPPAGCQ